MRRTKQAQLLSDGNVAEEDGFLRIVFLAPIDELTEIYDLMAAFTAQYLS